jgi:sulfur-carrier protein
MARLRLFGRIAEAAGTSSDEIAGSSVEDVLAAARARYGEPFSSLSDSCRIWLNGAASRRVDAVGPDDEVALLPPVSGG